MEITINSDLLQEHGFTVSEFVALYLIWKKKPGLVDKICDDVVFSDLQDKGWLKLFGADIEDWIIRDKFLDLVSSSFDRMWAELCATKPFKVQNGRGGYRVLRARDPDAATNKKARDLYKKVVGTNKALHDYIMKCLKVEMDTTDIRYMQNTETWIRQKTWEKFDDIEDAVDIKKDVGYGGEII